MTSCAFCGRANDDASRFCMDCGKALSPSAARVVPAGPTGYQSPFAAAVAARTTSPAVASVAPAPAVKSTQMPNGTCPHCANPADLALPFCPYCGGRLAQTPVSTERVGTAPIAPASRLVGPRLALLDDDGHSAQTYTLDRVETVVGRTDGDICFRDDVYMSPIHAQLSWREGQLTLRDLGSRNGSWVFLEAPARLMDGDVILVGSQLLRFRRLGYPGPHPPEADATRRLGSLTPSADIAVLAQLRSDGSVRDSFHLSPGRNIMLGREHGDWVFPYDQTMSGRHAEIKSEDHDFFVDDAGSRNGVALAVRGERELKKGMRILIGDQIMRVESL